MKICLKKINSMCSCNEYNLSICCDGCIGRQIRRNLPKCICGDGIKINIIVTGCDGTLEAPALPCNNLVAISSPIKVIKRNTCCNYGIESSCDDFNMDNLDLNIDESCNEDYISNNSIIDSFMPQEYAIIVRSFNPLVSQFLCRFPQMYISDCENTTKLIIIFDRNGSVIVPQNNSCCNSCCFRGGSCGCGNGFGGGCGCGFGLFGLAALALLFCC